jgi:RimJ/RimL family protein N-acetyltransferase
VGDALAAAVLSWGRQVGALAVRLRVIDHNAAARRLYGRHGFATTGHVVAAARDGGREAVEIEMEHRFPDPGPPRTGGDDEPAGGGPSAGSG